MNMFRLCSHYVQVMFWLCTEYVQAMFRLCLSYVQDLDRKGSGCALDMFRSY